MKAEDFQGIVAGLEDAIAFAKDDSRRDRIVAGRPAPAHAEVKTIRAKTKLSQAES